MEQSYQRGIEGHQTPRRTRFYRNNRGSGNFHRYRIQNSNESSVVNSTEAVAVHVEENQSSMSAANSHSVATYEKSPQYRNYNKQYRGRNYQYSVPKYSNYSHYTGQSNNNSDNSVVPTQFEGVTNQHSRNKEDELTSAQRGKIVGGRYVRKHSYQTPKHSLVSDQSYLQNCSNTEDCTNEPISNDSRTKNSYENSEYQMNPRNVPLEIRDTNRNKSLENDYRYSRKPQFQNSRNSKRFSDNESSMNVRSNEYPVYNFNARNKFGATKVRDENKISVASSVKYRENDASQRELLMHHLPKGEYECLVCCEAIRVKDQIWHCISCYHVFHLRCIRKWARSPAAAVDDGSWRCPACQSLTTKVPFDYLCFCGKTKNPDVNYHLTPHSCGEICERKRPDCSHPCKELCHPGPCPPCLVVVSKACACGKTSKTTPCNNTVDITCSSVCDKILTCGVHRCKSSCHLGDCSSCDVIVSQKCYCGKDKREVPCTSETATYSEYTCGNLCERDLNCGNHTCVSVCHPGVCNPCRLSPEVIKTCACGKSNISELTASGKAKERISCTDPIVLCGEICGKTLHCGPKDRPHTCQSLCHEGDCPPCPLSTSMKCRCGAFSKEFLCKEIGPSFVYLCEKRCNRRKDCGRHKCLNNCCTNFEHKCELICNRKLTCGTHFCQETCHMGNCPTCWNVSFDELRCHCGESVLYPPIHCGTKPPECSKPCIRNHPCGHEVKHTCHSDETCPPCTSLTVKSCYGNHKQCGSVMCFLDGVSCGMPCLKSLPCGIHKCQLTCHPGPCLKPEAKCVQPCLKARPSCGHPCGNQCHEGPCPDTPCKAQVTLTCPCGHRSETTTCYDSTKSYHLMSVTVLASKMQEIKEGQSVNLSDVLGKKSKNNKLQCSEECAVIERNKRLAVALQIQNPDLSCSPGPPSYSEFLKDEAKKNPHFVSEVYDKITELVQLAKQSKQKCRSHSFPPMNRDQRRVVHELAEFFGCETQSYDEEPKKNVVVTAYKTKSWLPFVSIMSVVQRDMGIRKGPAPVLAQRETKTIPNVNNPSVSSQKKKIDYFDYHE